MLSAWEQHDIKQRAEQIIVSNDFIETDWQ